MSGKDFEPIGKRKKTRPTKKPANSRRRQRRDDYDESPFDDEQFNEHTEYQQEDELMAKKSKKGRPNKQKSKWRWFWLLVKIALVITLLVGIYGVYLYQKVSERLDGKVWDLPAAVYGRMVNLEPGMDYSQAEMVRLLNGMQYRQVNKITRAGEFVVKGNTIEMLRRPFNFPDQKEDQILARLYFEKGRLVKIENMENNRIFGFFRLDPKLITMLQSPNNEQRLVLPIEDFPESLIKVLLETEDRRFYEHDGVSIYSIGRAVIANLTAGRAVQGGSTLTQQLVKNLFLTNERTLTRKANEAYMAVLMDYGYSKQRILELYLNEVYLGQSGDDQIRGFPLASLYYFGRPVDELSLDQQALLVGMVKGASLYNPWRNPKSALERRNVVLKLLESRGVIDQAMYDVLSARPLGVKAKSGVITPQPAFMQMVRQELSEKLGDKFDNLSGAKIFTTLDPVSQDAAENAVEKGVANLRETRKINDLEGAIVVVDRINGEVRAMVGGSQPQYSGFNRALNARRSIGSLAKPPVYLAALSEPDRFRLNTWLSDEPLALKVGNQTWKPNNYDRQFRGRVMLVDALAKSLNIPTVNLGLEVGLDQVVNIFVRLGAPANVLEKVPAMLLGAINLTPIETAQVYQTIGGNGNRAKLSALRSVIDGDGNEIYQSYPSAERAVPAQAAYLALYGMQQVVDQGTSRALKTKFAKYNLAAKTGTTNDLRDSWFAGIDGKEVTIVWVGRDNNGPTNLTGSTGALKIYQRYLDNQTPLELINRPPEGIVEMRVNADGQFNCSEFGGGRVLPVWTENPQYLCETQSSQQPNWNLNNNANPPQENDAPDWVKEMFGGNN
ncbi:bifunctional glycosyl transferase/transpeptidase [Moellerella wisconsensis]|uniref:Penicillin-binding protein 1B n=1 Tax=Moellerella wisconsensis TaxID=158849 RepID=A0A9Q8V406_9GAMM|nr:bifunctional glycosyl transferase/transpeptidase [Moellerella wisconsensis]KLN96019.1 bifunctional glycosyl transferase/transpeptidase [Moellerella wisconsensis]UNH26687.1 bifunctional glycosyl transferase/transpeptidase [Moellerella wisconsensis]UNH30171.1 bifunctional glycosyl transferase/transpeptidase [Moellerella wisconsensis]UNH41844.1 bifunctional glycosyl transferase/transpeptidase [Moellerella wisconsensis]WJW81313.1 bifunctional glycosyl transferase/transpeptidase [Moellerella wis